MRMVDELDVGEGFIVTIEAIERRPDGVFELVWSTERVVAGWSSRIGRVAGRGGSRDTRRRSTLVF